MQIQPTSPNFNPAAVVAVGPVERTSANMAATVAAFVVVAARGCRNNFARVKLQNALRDVLDAAAAIERDEARGSVRHV